MSPLALSGLDNFLDQILLSVWKLSFKNHQPFPYLRHVIFVKVSKTLPLPNTVKVKEILIFALPRNQIPVNS